MQYQELVGKDVEVAEVACRRRGRLVRAQPGGLTVRDKATGVRFFVFLHDIIAVREI